MSMALKLRELRRKNKMTQHEVAEIIGVSDAAYAMYETGKRIPRDEIKRKLSKVFQKPIGYIFFDEALTSYEDYEDGEC